MIMEPKIFDLGLVPFAEALSYQKEIFQKVRSGLFYSALILCRHHPVITLGRTAKKENILLSTDELDQKAIKIARIERGGDVTYHGPGQVTMYPVVNLAFYKKDIHFYLRGLEEIVIILLTGLGVNSQRIDGLTGVWVEDKKICSVGVAVRQWIAFHGLTLNVKQDDLDNFSLIRPCGMDIQMTSLEGVLDRKIECNDIKDALIEGGLKWLKSSCLN